MSTPAALVTKLSIDGIVRKVMLGLNELCTVLDVSASVQDLILTIIMYRLLWLPSRCRPLDTSSLS